jgi:hypothetical protein
MHPETVLHPPRIGQTNYASRRNMGPMLEPMMGLGGVNTHTRQRVRALAASTLSHITLTAGSPSTARCTGFERCRIIFHSRRTNSSAVSPPS